MLLIDHTMPTAAADVALARVLLDQVAAGDRPETVRISRPPESVAFGRQDRVRAGYADAVDIAQAHGFEPIERLAGGTAAVFHSGTIAVGWVVPSLDPKSDVEGRFERMADAIVHALDARGLNAGIGEIPGEYCPGRFSVSHRGRKIAGIGQRVVGKAAHVGAVIVLDGADRIATVLEPVYAALDYDFVPETTGDLGGLDGASLAHDVAMRLAGGEPPTPSFLAPSDSEAALANAASHSPTLASR